MIANSTSEIAMYTNAMRRLPEMRTIDLLLCPGPPRLIQSGQPSRREPPWDAPRRPSSGDTRSIRARSRFVTQVFWPEYPTLFAAWGSQPRNAEASSPRPAMSSLA